MNHRVRFGLFATGALGLAFLFGFAIAGLPNFGTTMSDYARAVTATTVPARHVSEAVGAVTFDFRGIDSLGEELILLVAVAGVAVLARRRQGEEEEEEGSEEQHRPGETTEAVRFFGVSWIAPTLLFGVSLAAHGYVTPGGGFQAGVVIASAIVLVFLAVDHETLVGGVSPRVCDPAEAFGVGTYAGMGVAGLIVGGFYLDNVLPYGRVATIASGGMLPMLNAGVAIAVAAALLLAVDEYLHQAFDIKRQGSS
jgi:multicomponent Na+:H+ antiporter subunit B